MNRRTFLQTLTAVFAAPLALASTPAPKPIPPSVPLIVVSGGNGWRYDVIYGYGCLSPSTVCRVLA